MRRLLGALALLACTAAQPAASADIPADLDMDLAGLPVSRHELVCLALNDYWESRGEPLAGRVAVAQVVLNRAMDPRYPRNICDVVKQNLAGDRLVACQFSWNCDGRPDHPTDGAAWRQSLLLAAAVVSRNSAIVDPTGGAKWYHARHVKPAWSESLEVAAVISNHVFYREPGAAEERGEDSQVPTNFADWLADRRTYAQIAQR